MNIFNYTNTNETKLKELGVIGKIPGIIIYITDLNYILNLLRSRARTKLLVEPQICFQGRGKWLEGWHFDQVDLSSNRQLLFGYYPINEIRK